jgi:hypothetical protein
MIFALHAVFAHPVGELVHVHGLEKRLKRNACAADFEHVALNDELFTPFGGDFG